MRASRPMILVVASAALLALLALLVWSLTPRVVATGPSGTTRDATPRLWASFNVAPEQLRTATVVASIDGRSVRDHAEVRGSGVVIGGIDLADGEHEVEVRISDVGVLQLSAAARWTVTVDRTPPDVDLVEPTDEHIRTTEPVLRFEIATDPGTTLVASGGRRLASWTADDSGTVAASYRLRNGRSEVRFVAVDAAGNRSVVSRMVDVDTEAPRVDFGGEQTISVRGGAVAFAVMDTSPARVVSVDLAGEALDFDTAAEAAVASATDGPAGTAHAARPGMFAPPLKVTAPGPDELAEGTHTLTVVAEDAFGNRRETTRSVLVDTTERLGDAAAVGPGARGDDVRELQQRLTEMELFAPRGGAGAQREWQTMTYGPETAAAVRGAQEQAGITADGIAGRDTVGSLLYRISIDRAANTLTLYRLGRVEKVYSVSTGTAQHPTPSGNFRIIDKQANPTWNPPDSDWAKDAKPIPPGPGNPLGTRWMGLDSPAIGIHGTPDAASLGYSRSHGCIRMAIPEAEELFDIVGLGTPVSIA